MAAAAVFVPPDGAGLCRTMLERLMVPGVGLEPTRLAAGDFESPILGL